MAGFKSLFKIRQPGHGEKFENRVSAAIASARAKIFPSKGYAPNSGGKEKKGVS
jgi:hypothetical protein